MHLPLDETLPIVGGASLIVLATGIGAILPIFLLHRKAPKLNHHDFACFSAGIMAYSIFEISSHSFFLNGIQKTILGFLAGFLAFLSLEYLLQKTKLLEKLSFHMRSLFVALSIAFHNIAEGLAVGSAFLLGERVGWEISIPISFQDIPEGFLVSAPLISKGMNPFLAILIGTLSGIVEAVFSFLSWETLGTIFSKIAPYSLGASAGGMAFIVLFDLLPEIEEYSGVDSRRKLALALFGFVLGALSLLVLL